MFEHFILDICGVVLTPTVQLCDVNEFWTLQIWHLIEMGPLQENSKWFKQYSAIVSAYMALINKNSPDDAFNF